MSRKIVLTGGGTTGHVAPNLALVPGLKAAGYKIYYIGSHNGIERELVEAAGIPYYGIASGKLRRYLSLKNVTDIFRIGKGLFDALGIMRKIKPDIVFSKGGFVIVPVIAAARLLGIKSVIHESDMTPGLANKLVLPIAKRVCVSFPETLKYVKKGVLTGMPLRPALFKGSREDGLKVFGGVGDSKPVLLVTGGSQGAAAINNCVRGALPQIMQHFRVIHLCGRGNLSGITTPGYVEFEYVNEGIADILQAADIVISRAGATTIFELVALNKPNLLIPLPLGQSRGDQIQNAASFEKQGLSVVLPENEMTEASLLSSVLALYQNKNRYVEKMKELDVAGGVEKVLAELETASVTRL